MLGYRRRQATTLGWQDNAGKVGQASRLTLAGTKVFNEARKETHSRVHANRLEDFEVAGVFPLALRARRAGGTPALLWRRSGATLPVVSDFITQQV